MRIIVLSDSHAMTKTLFEIIEMHLQNADLFIFLGDMDADFDRVLMLYPQIKYRRVAGNNDRHTAHPPEQTIEAGGKKIFFCHGHTYWVKHGYGDIISHCKSIGADICLFGHTHIPYKNYDEGLYIMNPGAVCTGCYGIIDIVESGVMTILSKL